VDENLRLAVSAAPSGWEARLMSQESGVAYGVRSLSLQAGKTDPNTIFFQAKPPAGAAVGDYTFVVTATSADKGVEASLTITIGIEDRAKALSRLLLVSSFPNQSGPTGSNFEYVIDITNEGTENLIVDLSAAAPSQWRVTFSPTFESGKQISSLGIKAGEVASVNVGIIPPTEVKEGKYGITVAATSAGVTGSLDLSVTLVNEANVTYSLIMNTATGRLNAEATAGQESHVSVELSNTGTGEIEGITLASEKPEGWVVTYSPSTLNSLAPGEVVQLDVAIKPIGKTLPGDYLVKLTSFGLRRGNSSVELRVAVNTPTSWGLVGIGIVLAVIAAMATIFFRLGRR
ncbi:MAG: NEW3 domain-containing protein, partial [Chloroflexota bacterium]